MNENYIIRQELKSEERIVENLVREAFWNVYKPGCDEHYLIHHLRNQNDFVNELNLVMVIDHHLIGHVAFVKSDILVDDGTALPTLTMGPFCIHPDYQRQGYGVIFLKEALQKAKEMNFGAVCIEGNELFYKYCGFIQGNSKGIRYENMPEDTPFFLVCELKKGYLNDIKGAYHVPRAYYFSKEEAEQFDMQFEPKIKLKLPGQLFSD